MEELFEFLRFKSVSTDPAFKDEVIACAKWVEKFLKSCGLSVEVWETDGYPILFGSNLKAGPDRPTVLIYHHYDVQPVDPLKLWESDPFEPEKRDGYIYARGAQDNKGQCYYSLCAVREYLKESSDVNIKVVVEGEEEIGSPNLSKTLPKEKLKADHLLIIDTDIPGENVPGVTIGLRGVVTMEVNLKGSKVDLHSGLYGGLAYNPNRALAELLTKCWDSDGYVTIPGFYDGVEDVEIDEVEPDLSLVLASPHEKGYTLVQQNWIRPVLEINGMGGGYVGEGFKTVIPAQAVAKLSVRTVCGQDPDKLMEAMEEFLKKNAAPGIEVGIVKGEGAPGFRTDPNSKTVAVVGKAYETVFGVPCKKVFCGASIPITPLLAKASGATAVMMGMGLPEDNIHAPNERIGVARLKKGQKVVKEILRTLWKKSADS